MFCCVNVPYLNSHQNLLLVRCQVVALSQKHFPKSTLSKLPLQQNVVALYVLDNCTAKNTKFILGYFKYCHAVANVLTGGYYGVLCGLGGCSVAKVKKAHPLLSVFLVPRYGLGSTFKVSRWDFFTYYIICQDKVESLRIYKSNNMALLNTQYNLR